MAFGEELFVAVVGQLAAILQAGTHQQHRVVVVPVRRVVDMIDESRAAWLFWQVQRRGVQVRKRSLERRQAFGGPAEPTGATSGEVDPGLMERLRVVLCQVFDQRGGLDEVFAGFDAHVLWAPAVHQQFVHSAFSGGGALTRIGPVRGSSGI